MILAFCQIASPLTLACCLINDRSKSNSSTALSLRLAKATHM